MLDTDTKRRIDTARDILVGKVPDPKSQVEQITIALIYKFMDDIDAQSEELGGQRTFFAGEFARYGWAKLMGPGLGGHEMLNLYAEAIARMPENPGIPPLFRDIFDNAFLPYRDPETLRAFLKVIDEFTYDHSERLGDAFEYLLSVLGSQGDAGQFRTPRHIIDFIVSTIDPKKDEVILDPACGTAGFLISSYKHILAANRDADGSSTLTPDDSKRLADNFQGYDISPDMVRLSLVNMYLHGFVDPHIFEYDTLTSEDRWNDFADVILANPPFMSPKGGIRPHNRFSVQSRRSEVLFVDYMAEHLNPAGRAGIIVPEGIIFQSQKAHTQLRKMLVEDYLVAVVSLPGGVFKPYSGVKTSILILDKALARKTDSIAFFKVENDGFDLGDQRRPISENDLPQVQAELTEYLRRLPSGQPLDDFHPKMGLVASKAKIATDGDYNLSGERYRETETYRYSFPVVSIGDASLFRVESGGTPKTSVEEYWNGDVPWVTLVDLPPTELIAEITDTNRTISGIGLAKSSAKLIPEDSVIVSTRATIGRIGINRMPLATNQGFKNIIIEDKSRAIPEYVALAMTKLVPNMEAWASGGTFKEISKLRFCELRIPLPPLEVQKEIMAEIESYQKVIDGARAVVDNYRPRIAVDPEWPMVELRDVCEINPDTINPALAYPDRTVFYVDISSVENGTGRFLGYNEVLSTNAPSRARRGIQSGDVLLSTVRPNLKAFTLLDNVRNRAIASTGFAVLRAREAVIDPTFVLTSVSSEHAVGQMVSMMGKGAYPSINQSDVASIKIALPPLSVQQKIVVEIQLEQSFVNANRELITRFEQKIQDTIGRVWGEAN